jgi:hypothetical protein
VFKFGDSIDHCSLTKYRISLNFTLLDSSLQDASFDVSQSSRNSLSFREKWKKLKKKSYLVFKFDLILSPQHALKYYGNHFEKHHFEKTRLKFFVDQRKNKTAIKKRRELEKLSDELIL